MDINYKSEGIVPRDETSKYTYYDEIKDGDGIDVYVKRRDNKEGMVLLSKIIADKKVVFSRVKKSFKDKTAIEGKIIKSVKGGYIIDFGANVTAFLPMSHSKIQGGQQEELQDRELPLKIIQLDEVKRNVVVSYREYVSEKKKQEEEKIMKVFPVNEKVKVKVAEVKEDGIAIEKDGVKVMVPASELAWKKIGNLSEKFRKDEIIEVLVVSSEKERLGLSVKRLKENPFKKFMEDKNPGERISVKVKELVPEGVVAEIGEDLDGFIPLSEISYYKRLAGTDGLYNKGDDIKACVLKIDESKNRIYLSVKRTEKNPWHSMEERYPVDARVFGEIKNIIEGEGVSVELEESFDAFMHVSNVSWFNFNKIEEVVKKGERKEFKILGIDKNKYRIMLGLKQLMPSPWATFISKYKEGSYIDVKIIEIEDGFVTCRIVEGVNGRIAIKNKNKLKNKKGDIIKARLNKIDNLMNI